MTMKAIRILNVKCCSRCEGDHQMLIFRPLHDPEDQHSHYAICPTTSLPIKMAIEAGICRCRRYAGRSARDD